jgi:hypothetical protein
MDGPVEREGDYGRCHPAAGASIRSDKEKKSET